MKRRSAPNCVSVNEKRKIVVYAKKYVIVDMWCRLKITSVAQFFFMNMMMMSIRIRKIIYRYSKRCI